MVRGGDLAQFFDPRLLKILLFETKTGRVKLEEYATRAATTTTTTAVTGSFL